MSPKDLVSAGGVSAQQLAEIEARLAACWDNKTAQQYATTDALGDVAALVEAIRILTVLLAEGHELALRNQRAASQRRELFAWGERAAAVLGTP